MTKKYERPFNLTHPTMQHSTRGQLKISTFWSIIAKKLNGEMYSV